MKYLSSILLLLFSFSASAQQLHVDWTRFVGGKHGELCHYTIPTRDGGVLFVGATSSVTAGGGDIPSGITNSSTNVYIGKMDSNRNIVWTKIYGGTGDDQAWSACQTKDGGYAILATTLSTDGDVIGAKGSNDIWLIRVDSMGNKLWAKIYGSSQDDEAISIASTPDNGLIVFGGTNGSDGDVPFHYGGFFSFDWLVMKLDSVGNIQWSKVKGSTSDEGTVGSIFYADSAYYFSSCTITSDNDCVDSSWHIGVNTNSDAYLFKLDTAGNTIWAHSYGGSSYEYINNAFWDNRDSSIVMAGTTASIDYMVHGYLGDDDMWVVKTNKDGILKWTSCLGGSNKEYGVSIATGPNKGYIALSNAFGYDHNQFPDHIGQQDTWAFIIDSIGHELTNKVVGSIWYETAASVVPYKDGYVLTGFTNDTITSDPQPFPEGSCTHLHGWDDLFITYLEYWPLSILPMTLPTEKLQIYPNPTKGIVRINFPSINNNESSLQITDDLGKIIFTQSIEANSGYIDIQTKRWAKGLYIVSWHNQEGRPLSEKLIVN